MLDYQRVGDLIMAILEAMKIIEFNMCSFFRSWNMVSFSIFCSVNQPSGYTKKMLFPQSRCRLSPWFYCYSHWKKRRSQTVAPICCRLVVILWRNDEWRPQKRDSSSISWSGWLFGTFFIFPCFGNNHPNWLSYLFIGVETPASYKSYKSNVHVGYLGCYKMLEVGSNRTARWRIPFSPFEGATLGWLMIATQWFLIGISVHTHYVYVDIHKYMYIYVNILIYMYIYIYLYDILI